MLEMTTAPAAINATTAALDKWRRRVVPCDFGSRSWTASPRASRWLPNPLDLRYCAL